MTKQNSSPAASSSSSCRCARARLQDQKHVPALQAANVRSTTSAVAPRQKDWVERWAERLFGWSLNG